MAINTLAAATLFMTMLDKVAVQEARTGWLRLVEMFYLV